MESTSRSQASILRSHVWCAGVQWYDFLQSIWFGTENWGFMSQLAGQGVKLSVNLQYLLQEPGRLHLQFFDTPSDLHPERLAFKRTERNASRDVAFDLISGPQEVACETMGGMVMRSFPWLLRFQCDALPVGYKRGETLLAYYGRLLRADAARPTFGSRQPGPPGKR